MINHFFPSGSLICVKEKKQQRLFFPKFFATQKTFLNANIKMKTIKELEENNSIEVAHGYNMCRKDVIKLIDELKRENAIFDLCSEELKARIEGK